MINFKITIARGDISMNIGLGTASFGTSISHEDSFKILNAFVNKGGIVIDTANNYAFWDGI